jgi:DNA repair protein RecO (recombination protein O)
MTPSIFICTMKVRDNGFICHRCFEKDPYRVPMSPQTARLLRLFYYFDIGRLGSVSLKQATFVFIQKVLHAFHLI